MRMLVALNGLWNVVADLNPKYYAIHDGFHRPDANRRHRLKAPAQQMARVRSKPRVGEGDNVVNVRTTQRLVGVAVLLIACVLALPAPALAAAPKLPDDDPCLPDMRLVPAAGRMVAENQLVALRTTLWAGLPPELMKSDLAAAAAQRVIFRDAVTGAEVWLLARSPEDEHIQYTNYRPFNADGSRLRVWGTMMCVATDGSSHRRFTDLIKQPFLSLPEWSATDADVARCQSEGGGIFECNLRTGARRDVLAPPPDMPAKMDGQLSDDGAYALFVSRQASAPPLRLVLTDGHGADPRPLAIRSRSQRPEADRMGSAAFLSDGQGTLYVRYSLNKGNPLDGPNPYQNYLIDLAGRTYIPMDSHNDPLAGPALHLVPAGSWVVAGHGGYSPSGRRCIHHFGTPGVKWVRDLTTWQQRDIARIPGCDHMDYTVDDNWFLVWARQSGLPIYKVFVDTGVTQRIVVTQSCTHGSGGIPYHGASPDGTKVVYGSTMLGNPDLYMAVMRYPEPPRDVRLTRDGAAVQLRWSAPLHGREVAGYHLYRSETSGGPYQRTTRKLVRAEEYRDPAPPARAYYALTSVEHCGLEGRIFSDEVAASWAGRVCRYWEAEAGKRTPPVRELFLPAACSGGFAIDRAVRDAMWQPASGEGRVEWTVALPRAGTFDLWLRARSRTGEALRLTVRVGDGAGEVRFEGQEWAWVRATGGPWSLPAGEAQVAAVLDAPGLELDKLLLTDDRDYHPAGLGNAPATPPVAPSELTAAWHETAPVVVLRWRPNADAMVHHYQVFRVTDAAAAPGLGTLIGSPAAAAFIDPSPPPGQPLYYKVAAVDSWGNMSAASAAITVPAHGPAPTRVRLDLSTATLSGQAHRVGDVVAFGEAGKPLMDGGELALPVTLPPGTYYVWLHARCAPATPRAFVWVSLGKTRRYMLLMVPATPKDCPWTWRRAQSIRSGSETAPSPLIFDVKDGAAKLTIRHRAHHVLFDAAYITSSAQDLPEPDAWRYHAGCTQSLY